MTQAHILVAISDQQITFLLERVLKSAGYSISLQENPATIQRTVELNPPTLIILGETIGGASGMEIAATLLRRFPAIPVLLFISHESPALLKQAMQLGVSDTFCLPLR